jgi:hypothetical protein
MEKFPVSRNILGENELFSVSITFCWRRKWRPSLKFLPKTRLERKDTPPFSVTAQCSWLAQIARVTIARLVNKISLLSPISTVSCWIEIQNMPLIYLHTQFLCVPEAAEQQLPIKCEICLFSGLAPQNLYIKIQLQPVRVWQIFRSLCASYNIREHEVKTNFHLEYLQMGDSTRRSKAPSDVRARAGDLSFSL